MNGRPGSPNSAGGTLTPRHGRRPSLTSERTPGGPLERQCRTSLNRALPFAQLRRDLDEHSNPLLSSVLPQRHQSRHLSSRTLPFARQRRNQCRTLVATAVLDSSAAPLRVEHCPRTSGTSAVHSWPLLSMTAVPHRFESNTALVDRKSVV